MRHSALKKAIVVFMSLVLVFSSNSTVLTPVIAYAIEASQNAQTEDSSISYEVVDDTSDVDESSEGAEEDTGDEVPSDAQVEGEQGESEDIVSDGDSSAEADTSDTRTEAKVLTDETSDENPLVSVESVKLSYADASESENVSESIEAVKSDEGNFDLDASVVDLASASDIAVTYSTKISAGWIAGDGIKLYVPNKNLTVDAEKLLAWAEESTDVASAEVDTESDSANTVVTFKLAGADEDGAGAEKTFDLQIPVSVVPEELTLEEETDPAAEDMTFEVALALPNSKYAQLTFAKSITEAAESGTELLGLEDEPSAAADPVTIEYNGSATLTKTWYDGVDANRPVETLKDNLKIFFKLENSDDWAEYTADIASLITDDGTKTVPEITTSSSANPFIYKAEKLPSTTSAGKTISYKIAESKTMVESGETYNIPVSDGDIVTLGNNKYKVEVSADGSSIGNVKLKDFSFTLKMHNGNAEDKWAPTAAEIYQQLSVTNNGGSPIVIDEDAVSVTKNSDGTFTVTIANLPEFSSSDALGAEIGYKATLANTERTDGTYYAEYNNAAVPDFGSDTTTVHEGGTLDYIRKADATYTMTKEWRDGLSDSALDSEKAKRPDTIFTLWRYVDDGTNTFRNAATVLKSDGTPYTFSANKQQNSTDYTVTQLVKDDSSTNLPKYNADGYEYVYFVRESMGKSDLGTYKQVFGAYDEEGGLDDTTPGNTTREKEDLSIYNGGTVNNSLSGTVETKVTKTWAAAAHQAYLKYYKTVMRLEARHVKADEGEGIKQEWYYCDSNGNETKKDYVNENLYNFASETTTKTASKTMPRFDMNGYELEYRWVEVTVTQGDSPITEASDPGKVDYTVNYKGATSRDDELTDSETGVTTYIKTGTVSTGYNVTSEEGGRQNEDYYSVTNSTVNGETTTTNKLVGKIDYQVTKYWLDSEGNPIEVPGNATYALYKAGTEVATFTVATAPKQEGSITGAGGTVYGSYTVTTPSTGVQTITISDLDKYTDGGELVSYFVSEKGQVTAGGVTYAASYQYDNENRTATITNKPGKGGVQIRVEKQWLDDSDSAHRLPVTFEVSYENNAGEKLSREVTVSAKDNWFALVGLGDAKADSIEVAEKYVTDTDGTKYYVSYSGDASEQTGSLETQVGGSVVDGFKYVVTNLGKQDVKVAGFDNYVSTNRRVGTVNLTVTKTWNDVGATKSERPAANVVLSSSSAGVKVENNYVALEGEGDVKHYIVGKSSSLLSNTPSTDDHTTEDGVVASATQNVNSTTDDSVTVYYYALPKYDMQGKMITYNVAETLGEDAAEKSYTSTISAGEYTIGSDYHFTDFQTYAATNTRTKSVALTINKVWNDAYQKSLGHRSDLSLILWQRYENPDGTTTIEKYRTYGYKDYAWAPTQGSTSADALTATFNDLPCYTSNGAEITYFFEETYNNPKATTDYDYNKVKYTGGEVVYLNAKGEVLTGEGASAQATHTLLQAGGTFTNGISSTVTVEGAKVWTNIPSAIRNLVTLPAIKVNVYQQSRKEGSDKKLVAAVDSSELNGKKKSDTEAGVNGFVSNNNASNKWEFVVYYEDEDANKTPLPKYDDEGYLYDYTIEEVVEGAVDGGAGWDTVYDEGYTYFTAENEYKTDNAAGALTVTKEWTGRENVSEADDRYPVVTFKLHQLYKGSDGNFIEVKAYTQKLDANVDTPTDGQNTVSFTNLAVYAPDGTKYYYYLTEENVDGYEFTLEAASGTEATSETYNDNALYKLNAATLDESGKVIEAAKPLSFNLANDYQGEEVFAVKANKYWTDAGDELGIRPENISLKLTRKAESGSYPIGEETLYEDTIAPGGASQTVTIDGKTVTISCTEDSANNAWTINVDGLQRWAPNGQAWEYDITETANPTGYVNAGKKINFKGSDVAASGETLDLTSYKTSQNVNKFIENKFGAQVAITKTWNDGGNKYGTRPTYVKVQLQYATSTTAPTNGSDVTSLEWKDASSANNEKLNDVLQARIRDNSDNTAIGTDGTFLVKLASTTTQTWSNLPSILSTGDTTTYLYYRLVEVTEADAIQAGVNHPVGSDDTELYNYDATNGATTVSGSKFTTAVTNKLETESLTINKTWDDNGNFWGQRGNLSFILQYKEGDTWKDYKPTPTSTITFTITSSDVSKADTNLWTKTITGLPKEDAEGNLYQWRVAETGFQRYKPSVVEGNRGPGTSETTSDGYASGVTNTLNTSKIKLVKYGEGDTANTLKNISFKVARIKATGTSGTTGELFTWKIDADGKASGTGDAITSGGVSVAEDGTITGLPIGVYTFTEDSTTTDNDALAKNMVVTVTIAPNGSVSSATATAKTDNGKTTVDSGLVSSATEGGVTTLMLTDPKAEVSVTLQKYLTGTTTPVAGATFELTKDSDESFAKKTVTTGTDGSISLGSLEVGNYTLTETAGSATSYCNNNVYKFAVTNTNGGQVAAVANGNATIDATNSKVTVYNDAFQAKVSFTKKDATSLEALGGATYTLQYRAATTDDWADEVKGITSKDGTYTADLSKKGYYQLVETAAPAGYKLPKDAVASFTVVDSNQWDSAKENYVTINEGNAVTDERILGTVKITKTDDSGSTVSDVTFTLTDQSDKTKTYMAVTQSDGVATFTDVAWGTYNISETTPSGYTDAVNLNPATVTVEANTVATGYSVTAGNARTSLTLDKVTGTGAFDGDPVNGVTLTVYAADDTNKENPLLTWTRAENEENPDEAGAVSIEIKADTSKDPYKALAVGGENSDVIYGLPAGSYILSETSTPADYLTADDVNFTIAADGKVSVATGTKDASVEGNKLTMTDELVFAQIRLTKTIDGKANPALAQGTTFDLYAMEGSEPDPTKDTKLNDKPQAIGTKGTCLGGLTGSGVYYYLETSAPAGVELDATPVVFRVSHDSAGEAVKFEQQNADSSWTEIKPDEDGVYNLTKDNNSFTSTVTWTKVDGSAEDAAITSAAAFELKNTSTGTTYSVTNNGGVYSATVSEKGTYTLTETKAPKGYEDVAEGGTLVATFELKDADCDQSLTLKSDTAQTAGGETITYADGKWSSAGLKNTRKTGSLTLLKVDSLDASKGLEGAEFTLTGTSGQAEGKTYTLTTDDKGIASASGLPWGAYTLTETKAPTGYTNQGWAPQTFEIGADNLIQTFEGTENSIENVASKLVLDKIDDESIGVYGAKLKLTASDGTEVLTWERDWQEGGYYVDIQFKVDTTQGTYKNLRDARGEATSIIYGLPVGTYTITETTTPDEYVTAVESTITVNADGTITKSEVSSSVVVAGSDVAVIDERAKVDVNVQKTIAGGAEGTVSGVAFELHKKSDDSLVAKATSGTNGIATFKDIYVGEYYVVETAAPADVVIDTSKKVYVTVTNDGGKGGIVVGTTDNTVAFENEAFSAAINFKKVDSEDNSKVVTGAKFQLSYTPEGESEPTATIEVVDNNDGTYSASNLKKGSYKLFEISSPDGYEVVDSTEAVAVFDIDNDNAGETVNINYKNVLTNTPVLVNLGLTKLGYINEMDDATKLDTSATAPLEGAKFALTQIKVSNENYVWDDPCVVTSNAKGEVIFWDVPEGTYTLEEVATSDAYHELWDKTVTFTIDRDGEVEVTADPEITDVINEYKLQSVSFTKLADTDGRAIAGATYELYRVVDGGNDLLVSTKTTDAEGKIAFTGLLPDKTYRIHEVATTAGSLLSKDDVTFSYVEQEDGSFKLNLLDKGSANGANTMDVDEDGNLVWNEPQTEYSFVKLDENGNALSGAKLQVLDASKNIVDEWTSDGTPHSIVSKLSAGKKYTLHEVSAPAGYDVAADVEFTVSADAVEPGRKHTQTITMVDKKTPETPAESGTKKNLAQTGDTMVGNTVLGVVALVGAAFIGAGIAVAKRKK